MFRFSASRVVILSALTGLSGCVAGFSALDTVTPEAGARDGTPASEVVVNMGCFESYEREQAKVQSGSGYGGGGGLFGGRGAPKGGAPSASAPAPRPAMAPPPMAPMMEEADDLGFAAPAPARQQPRKKKKEVAVTADAEPAPMEPVDRVVQAGPTLDYGGETWLSNDDSMSLASAQRLLWAVDNHRSWTASQIRPHELLNYFSFDTVPVAPGAQHDDTRFSVLGTARLQSRSFPARSAEPFPPVWMATTALRPESPVTT